MERIFKLTGAGNNFLIVDLRNSPKRSPFNESRARWARNLCDPHFSVGADGLLFLENSKFADLQWDFYNADGSKAEMCGNAARCVGRYIMLNPGSITSSHFSLKTKVGIVQVTTPTSGFSQIDAVVPVSVELAPLQAFVPNQSIGVGRARLNFDYVNSGVPHAAIYVATGTKLLQKLDVNVDKYGDIVHKIRALTQFKRHGTNVTFYSKIRKNCVSSFTFERGVTGYTQACGTGAVAAAVSYLRGTPGKVTVRVPGGTLMVDLRGRNPVLTGPAQFICEVKLKIEK